MCLGVCLCAEMWMWSFLYLFIQALIRCITPKIIFPMSLSFGSFSLHPICWLSINSVVIQFKNVLLFNWYWNFIQLVLKTSDEMMVCIGVLKIELPLTLSVSVLLQKSTNCFDNFFHDLIFETICHWHVKLLHIPLFFPIQHMSACKGN